MTEHSKAKQDMQKSYKKPATVSFWQALSFNVLSTLTAVGTSLVYVVCFFLPFKARGRILNKGMRCVLYLCDKILGLNYEVIGHVPKGEVIIASKHQSYWETVSFNIILDTPTYILKRELLFVPIWGLAAYLHNLIFVQRGGGRQAITSMLKEAQKKFVGSGRPLVIYPQGTRLAPGVKAPYKRGVAFLYNKLNCPVVPVALNSGAFWGRHSFMKSSGTICVSFLEPIPPGLSSTEMLDRLETVIETESDRLLQNCTSVQKVETSKL